MGSRLLPQVTLGYPVCAMGFREKLRQAVRSHQSWLCVGLDPDPAKLPKPLQGRDTIRAVEAFLAQIIEATRDLVCAYKPNSAFYEALGPEGFSLLRRLICEIIPEEIPVILDAKRGDIATTARKYAEAVFEALGADAVTVNPYLGFDAVEPFLPYADRAVFLLCRTSNPSARDLQDLMCRCAEPSNEKPLYQIVAEKAKAWQTQSKAELGLVVGATYPEELSVVRQIVGDEMLLLVPGVGAQGGDLERAVRAAANAQGENAIINVARGVLYASSGDDFAEAARREAERLKLAIQQALTGAVR